MFNDEKQITETAENKATADAIDRARLARERREAEQKKRLDELRAHAAAAQAQREMRDEERRRRKVEQRARDDDRRQQVEERKRAIWEASVSRREALLQREKVRMERLEIARTTRSSTSPRSPYAFGSSTPRLLEPVDSSAFFWKGRRATSTTNVMFASASLSKLASAFQQDSENDNRDEGDRQPQTGIWSSVARRRTDLVPTMPASRAPETRSGETTPGSRPGSAMSAASIGAVRRQTSFPRKPRPVSIAGTGVNTPTATSTTLVTSGESKPPVHRKPKSSKDYDKTPRGKVLSASSRVTQSSSSSATKEDNADKEFISNEENKTAITDKNQLSAIEVKQKLEVLQNDNGETRNELINYVINNKEVVESQHITTPKMNERNRPVISNPEVHKTEKKESSQEKTEENELTASMTARRITTEEEAKAALAERRRRAREESERQADLERQRQQREAEEEAEFQRQEEQRQRHEEEEAHELAKLQRRIEEEKLRKAIEAQQQLEREDTERKVREEAERQARLKEEEEKRKTAEQAERLRKEEAAREEKERIARKQRVEAIMARTRLKKIENKAQENTTATSSNKVVDCSPNENAPSLGTSSGNVQQMNSISHITTNFIQTEGMFVDSTQTKISENISELIDDDFTSYNGHGATHNHHVTLQNEI